MFLILNAGSSSLKFAVFDRADEPEPVPVAAGQVARLDGIPRMTAARRGEAITEVPVAAGHGSRHRQALDAILNWLERQDIAPLALSGVGHRIVHGGTRFTTPVRVGEAELRALDALQSLAPLHMIYGIEVLRHVRGVAPDVPQIACFDTAFHASQPDVAVRLALPARFHQEGYRRYGFHGLNYEHVVAEWPRVTGTPLPSRVLVFHLGSGASIAAIKDGRSVATTMGYSTLDGLVMGTRTGGLDPGVMIALMRDKGYQAEDFEDLLYRKSGLLALSGQTGDMRQLLANMDAESKMAVDHYCYWASRHAASLVAALGGLDAIVFTGGVGESAAQVRATIVDHLAWMGLDLDPAPNAEGHARIASDASQKGIWIIPANEELAIARHVEAMLVAR
jgi:acetate kinase